MSSTGRRERGQALAIFTISLTAILMAAALAFDVGSVMLERRDQQNAADAAAMAGVRYIKDNHTTARDVAFRIATQNGFDNDVTQVVTVNIPPTSGQFATWPNTIEVIVSSTRPSLFAGIAGILDWPVSARAVAFLSDGDGAPASILALDPDACGAVYVGGNGGTITANGNLQVNSTCPTHALMRKSDGNVIIESPGKCNVVGGIMGEDELRCDYAEGALPLPDPFEFLWDVPPTMGYPSPPLQVGGDPADIPKNCPGGTQAATLDSPATCSFPSMNAYKGTTWRLYPGLYPGGLSMSTGTYLLEPGVYWIGGGGLSITGQDAELRSVDEGGTEFGGGVLLYNTQLPHDTGSDSPIKMINLGGGTAKVHLAQLKAPEPGDWDWSRWIGIVIYQDRHAVLAKGASINGNASEDGLHVLGTIYVPEGEVSVNGNDGETTVDQIIARTFTANGNGGNINAEREGENLYQFTGAGLVE